MTLQGDLKSFALPDVLRLLAGTGKSGVLEVAGITATGEVLLRQGTIAAASTTAAPRATEPSDVVFELLRFEDGSFTFDEGDVADTGLSADVEATIDAAEALVDEWSAIEAVVPSMDAWISLAPELDADEAIISADRWRVLVAIGGGGNVHDLASAMALTDMAASRQVVDLVTEGLAHVRATHGYQPPRVELDDFDQFEAPLADPMTDLHDLSSEDRPVVMEESEDALLPEPLPGEGVAYEGESITGIVDGRTFDPYDGMDPMYEPSPIDGRNDEFEQFESLASFEEAAAMSDRIGEPGTIEGFGDVEPIVPFDPHGFGAGPSVDEPALPEPPVPAMETAAPADSVVDDERDSLLKFLSSVKP